MPRPAALYNHRKWQLTDKSQWCCSAVLQLLHTPPPQSTTPGLHPVSIHQMAPPVRGSKHSITAYYSVYRPRKDERLSRPGWLVTYRNKVPPSGVEPRHVTHPSTNRARRRVTLLMLPTPLPLHHAANRSAIVSSMTISSNFGNSSTGCACPKCHECVSDNPLLQMSLQLNLITVYTKLVNVY